MRPKAKARDAVHLRSLLSDGRWHKGREINMNHRMIRAVCAAYPDHFISSQRGYKLLSSATANELETAIADLRSRIKHLAARADAVEIMLARRQGREQLTIGGL